MITSYRLCLLLFIYSNLKGYILSALPTSTQIEILSNNIDEINTVKEHAEKLVQDIQLRRAQILSSQSLLLREDTSREDNSNQQDYKEIFMEQNDSMKSDLSNQNSLITSMLEWISNRSNKIPVDDILTGSELVRRERMNSFIDGISAMDNSKANARDISNAFGNKKNVIINSFRATDLLWSFGQFVAHELSQVNVKQDEICNIETPLNDPFLPANVKVLLMNRSNFVLDLSNVAQQINNATSVFDAENVYGSTYSRMNFIRAEDSASSGKLRTSGLNLLPKNTEGFSNRGGDTRVDFFLAGDVRANENLGLIVSHTLWVREHNYWVDEIQSSYPELSGEYLFQIARAIVQAEIQKIIYDEFLPALLGKDAIPEYTGYKSNIETNLENIFSSCVFRMGHTMVGPTLLADYGNGTYETIALEDSFFTPVHLERLGGIDAFLRGMVHNVCQEVDPFIVPAMRNHLFSSFDLLAVNIQRARDHGIPNFNSIRASLGFEKLASFDDFLFREELASVYSDTDQIDCWIGMNSEPRINGLMVGQTQRTILARNFANVRDGDINFYKNSILDSGLLTMIESTTFLDVIHRNSDRPGSLDDIQNDVFFLQN